MPVAVVKLGSSIVAEHSGELRLSVVARITEEVAALHRAGVDVVLVTSGAIARGMQLLGMAARPAAVQKLHEWRIVPVINENDTTTTNEVSFGDNDFLAAQVSVLVNADVLVLLTDTEGLYTDDPRTSPDARLVEEVTDPESLKKLHIGHAPSPLGSGGMRSKVVAAEMASAAGSPALVGSRDGGGVIG